MKTPLFLTLIRFKNNNKIGLIFYNALLKFTTDGAIQIL